jgi:hypothetical protein
MLFIVVFLVLFKNLRMDAELIAGAEDTHNRAIGSCF